MVPYHEEISGKAWSMWQHHIPLYKALSNYNFTLTLLTAGFFNFDRSWNLSIHKFIIELHVLQCLFVRGSNKKQRRGRIISNFISYLYQPSDNIAMWSPFLHPSKKGLSFPFSLGKKRIYLETQLKGEFIYWFILKIDSAPCSHRQSRNRMLRTLL